MKGLLVQRLAEVGRGNSSVTRPSAQHHDQGQRIRDTGRKKGPSPNGPPSFVKTVGPVPWQRGRDGRRQRTYPCPVRRSGCSRWGRAKTPGRAPIPHPLRIGDPRLAAKARSLGRHARNALGLAVLVVDPQQGAAAPGGAKGKENPVPPGRLSRLLVPGLKLIRHRRSMPLW